MIGRVAFLVSLAIVAVSAQQCEGESQGVSILRKRFIFLVCKKVLDDVMAKVPAGDKSKPDAIGKVIREHCESTKNKEHKFVCFSSVFLSKSNFHEIRKTAATFSHRACSYG